MCCHPLWESEDRFSQQLSYLTYLLNLWRLNLCEHSFFVTPVYHLNSFWGVIWCDKSFVCLVLRFSNTMQGCVPVQIGVECSLMTQRLVAVYSSKLIDFSVACGLNSQTKSINKFLRWPDKQHYKHCLRERLSIRHIAKGHFVDLFCYYFACARTQPVHPHLAVTTSWITTSWPLHINVTDLLFVGGNVWPSLSDVPDRMSRRYATEPARQPVEAGS